MRSQTLLATLRTHARRNATPEEPTTAALLASARDAIARGATRIVLRGGEPTLRPDLDALASALRDAGAKEIELCTDAARIDAARARALLDAGVTAIAVRVATTNPELHARVVSAITHPRMILRGLSTALAAGLRATVELPVAAELPPAAARIVGLSRAIPGLRVFSLAILDAASARAQGLTAVDAAAAAQELLEAYDVAAREKLVLALDESHPIAPCVIEVAPRARRLFAAVLRDAPGATATATEACARCALADRCTLGASDAAHVARAVADRAQTPIADASWLRPGKSAGHRLHVLDERDVEQFFHVDYEFGADVHSATSRIGILYRCNQLCTFCELADMDTEVPVDKVRAALEKARARGSVRVILTGGEPTLSPHLLDHVKHARACGFEQIELQTNAVLLDKPGVAEALREAGLTSAQVSLHGPDGAISDRLTAAPGTHARTMRGVDALLRVGVRVLLNHLVFKDNCQLLLDFVEMANARWGAHRAQLTIQFHSPRNEFASREDGLAHVARYREYVDVLRRAIDRARELGIGTYDLQDPTGVPSLCVLGASETYLGPILAQASQPRFHEWESEWLTRVPACSDCDVKGACMGVPRHYLALHGDEEFTAIRRPA
jgi:molybdenum cofactor biosynthesis enzyme MoaA